MAEEEKNVKGRIIEALMTAEMVADVVMSVPQLPPPTAPQLEQPRRAESVLVTESPTSVSHLVDQAADVLEREHERFRESIPKAPELSPRVVHDPLTRERERKKVAGRTSPKRGK